MIGLVRRCVPLILNEFAQKISSVRKTDFDIFLSTGWQPKIDQNGNFKPAIFAQNMPTMCALTEEN